MSDPLMVSSRAGRPRPVLTAVLAVALVATVANVAQARRDASRYAFSYGQAVSCAAALTAGHGANADQNLKRAYLRYSLAASELGRRNGLSPPKVDKAIAATARQHRGKPAAQQMAERDGCLQRLGRV